MKPNYLNPVRRCLLALSVAAAVSTTAVPALADDLAGAANAFSKGQKAELTGNYPAAAELFELADSLAPSPEAVRSALRARVAAGHLGTAAVHAEALLERDPENERSKNLAQTTLDEARRTLVRLAVTCRPRGCAMEVDGAVGASDARERHTFYVAPGEHELVGVFNATRSPAQKVQGAAGEALSLSFVAPAESSTKAAQRPASFTSGGDLALDATGDAKPSESGGLSPWFFATSAVITAGLGGAAIWSGIDVARAHSAYEEYESREAYEAGVSKERRTNILIGGAAASAAITLGLALFTDWDGSEAPKKAARPGAVRFMAAGTTNSALLSVGGSY
ncbi:MAG TPA: hypothetical protein VI072_36510 [Polyangiaceae bacterium]